jgi:N-acetylglucosaminyldiphosphoundecaprenol N-acetyl-beta-D-mannosaminyltransferase
LKTIHCLGYNIHSTQNLPEDLTSGQIVINTINPHCYCEAKDDESYKEALLQSDILIPDGIGIVWAVRYLTGSKIKRFAGSDLHSYLLQRMNDIGGKVFYMGSSHSTLHQIQNKIKREFPNIIVGTYSPPYKEFFNHTENERIVTSINEFQPDILFVGMTAPKQEKWVHQHKDLLNAKVIASIGAVFDFYCGKINRAPQWMIKSGLEWLYRLIKEPRRMWRRYLISNIKFIWFVNKEKFKG